MKRSGLGFLVFVVGCLCSGWSGSAAEPQDAPETMSAAERHYMSRIDPNMTREQYFARRKAAAENNARWQQEADEAWERALPIVEEWEHKGKPYIPWAAKPSDLPQDEIPAFPGAWGGGMYSFGGRGGRVCVVTSLEDAGPGTLREALEAGGPRTVVFNVAGLIMLKSPIHIRAPYITISGATAPGDGVCIGGDAIEIDTHDVIMRHLRGRRGVVDPFYRNDSISGHGVGNNILDHVSGSWGSDEVISIYRHMYQPPDGTKARKLPTVNITIQYTTFAAAVNGHQHGLGATIGGHNSTFHHNLFVSNMNRNPSVGMDGDFNFINNVIYNWQGCSIDGGNHKSLYQIVNNYYKPGPATVVFHVLKPERNHYFDPQDYYVSGNIVEGHFSADDDWAPIVEPKDEKLTEFVYPEPSFDSFVRTQTAEEAYGSVLDDVGCNVPMLDEHDQRIIRETRTGTTTYVGSLTKTPGVVNSQEDSGGWEDYTEVHRPEGWDTDRDGIPNHWEAENWLDPDDPSDAVSDHDRDGYTAIEHYLESLIREKP